MSEDDFREFVLSAARGLQRTAWLLTGNWASAEDLVQTTLLKVWQKWALLLFLWVTFHDR